MKSVALTMSLVFGLTAAASAQAPPILYSSGFSPSDLHVGFAACHITVDDPFGSTKRVFVGFSPLNHIKAATDVMTAAQCALLKNGVPFQYSLTGKTVPCSPGECGVSGIALEMGDIKP